MDHYRKMTTKTYLLVPNFDYPVGSSISLGALLADPFRPHRALARLEQDQWPDVTTTSQRNHTITRTDALNVSLSSATAQIFQVIDAKLGGGNKTSHSTEYSMNALRSEFFACDPSIDQIKELLRAPRVQSAMRSTFLSQPLYLITGLKIAQGFAMSTSSSVHHNAGLGGSLPIPAATGVTLGAKGQISSEMTKKESFTADSDIILAYRLLKITRKGWKREELTVGEYKNKSAFLGDNEQLGNEDEKSTDDIDIEGLTATGISLDEDEDDSMVLGKIQDILEDTSYIFLQDRN